jgi:hypothetical protein
MNEKMNQWFQALALISVGITDIPAENVTHSITDPHATLRALTEGQKHGRCMMTG